MPAPSGRRDDTPEAAARALRDDAPPAAKPKTGLWQALANLSIGRGTDREKSADIVHKGETVTLTEEQSQGFLSRHKVPVIRPAAEQNAPAPQVRAKDLFGKQPGAAQFGAREDPPGSSRVTVSEAEHVLNAPEAHDPGTDLAVDPDAAKDK
jgi:hypothetical protein